MHFLKSLLFTLFSPKFYADAVKKGHKKAWGVFFLFTVLTTFFAFIYFAINMGSSLMKLPKHFDDFPKVTVANNQLTIEGGKQVYEFNDNGNCVIINDEASMEEVDFPNDCISGFLLLKNTIVVRSDNEPEDFTWSYDEFLSEVNKDSFELDGSSLSSFFQTFGVVLIIISPIFLFIWQILSRLFMVLLFSVLGVIVMSLLKQQHPFNKAFIVSIYVSIPVFYINTFFSLFRKVLQTVIPSNPDILYFGLGRYCCLLPFFVSLIKWGIFWTIAVIGISKRK